ncbi:MAG: RDD family protein, partial [Candidatus Eremiobacteraeota bacterium]|nr:RDD family protein [Candidatus Eremiobacteraeota bacterium]
MIPAENSLAVRRSAYDETHTIDTPEQSQIEFTVAGIGSRGVALLIDTLIQLLILVVGLLIFAILPSFGVSAKLHAANVWVAAALIVAGFLLYYGYFILFEVLWNGQTPGKRGLGIRVIKDSGRRLSALETIGRNLLRIVDQLPGFYAVGMTVSLLNRRNKRLGDLIAGSIVVRERSGSRAMAQSRPSHAGMLH